MTLAEFKERIEAHSPGSRILREWLLDQLNCVPEAGYDSIAWVAIKEASAVTGLREVTLRSRAPHWSSFAKPEIHVRKMNPEKVRSPWLFSEDDCMAYKMRHGEGSPALIPDVVDDPNDLDALKAHYREKVTAPL